jgi:hypothetical protein
MRLFHLRLIGTQEPRKLAFRDKKLRHDIEHSAGPNFWETRFIKYEDADNDSDNGVTVTGFGPDNRNATDADADERNGDYGAGEREEDAPRASAAGQTSGKA